MVHHLTHGFRGSLIGPMAIAGAHSARGGDSRLLDNAQQLQTELNLHHCSRHNLASAFSARQKVLRSASR
jgi:hypothetical protein